jgi:two-component system, LuxR family, response regulator FixJ
MPAAAIFARNRQLAIVDDDPGALRALSFLLELDGYRVRAFRSGAEFLEAARNERPDCLVVDQNMPAMTGLELAERLRGLGATIPVVMITATPSAWLALRARELGIHGIVEKPIFGAELAEAIESCLGSADGADFRPSGDTPSSD